LACHTPDQGQHSVYNGLFFRVVSFYILTLFCRDRWELGDRFTKVSTISSDMVGWNRLSFFFKFSNLCSGEAGVFRLRFQAW